MKVFSRLKGLGYCAFCKTKRRLYTKKHVDATNVAAVGGFALAVTYAAYGFADPRGLLIFSLFVVMAEMFVYFRWRSNLTCRMCGFDPVLYKQSPERASKAVRQFFDEAANKPEFWLSRSPLLQLHRRLRKQEVRRKEIEFLSAKHKRPLAVRVQRTNSSAPTPPPT
jgi:hypothetical protein